LGPGGAEEGESEKKSAHAGRDILLAERYRPDGFDGSLGSIAYSNFHAKKLQRGI
jgi:hypothetical protein